MKYFNELLGFAVLSGPLWLILILLPVCIWIAYKVAKRLKPGSTRIAGGVGVFLLLFFLPFGDEIAGRIYFNYLCATEAGVQVYQTVELPAEYWDEQGRPNFIKGIGAFDPKIMTGYTTNATTENYPSIFRIKSFKFRYIEKQSGKILGEVITYHYLGGWVTSSFGASPIGSTSCDRPELRDSKGIILSIFRPVDIQRK